MNAITVSGKIEKGIIQLPENYKQYENAKVLVIILEDEKQNQQQTLVGIFNEMKEVKMFDGIQNPIEWQKKLRNEWD